MRSVRHDVKIGGGSNRWNAPFSHRSPPQGIFRKGFEVDDG